MKDKVKDKVCLELGAGCGLVSITLNLLLAKYCYATDLEDIISENTTVNINYNKDKLIPISNDAFESNIMCRELEWGNIQHLKDFSDKKIDILICCECLYKEAPWEKLLDTIIFFSELNREIEIIFGYKRRYSQQELFLTQFEKMFDIKQVELELLHEEFRNGDFIILLAKLKNSK